MPLAIARGLRDRAIALLTAQADGHNRAADATLLDRASALGRTLRSFDRDLRVEAALWQQAGVACRLDLLATRMLGRRHRPFVTRPGGVTMGNTRFLLPAAVVSVVSLVCLLSNALPVAADPPADPCMVSTDPVAYTWQGDLPPTQCAAKAEQLYEEWNGIGGPYCWSCSLFYVSEQHWTCFSAGQACWCCVISIEVEG